jgi:SEC-C motif-containing protein
MRARYSAFAEGDLDFIRDTLTARGREDHDEAGTRDWALHSKWHGLEVVSSSAGGKDDDEGEVEFVASYSQRGKRVDHHERALFVREDGKWRFSDSKGVAMGTIKRDEPKVGRNEPCRCGSGKKAKKCCGAI